ncbi:F510_1955 family glycosylhydrolase [Micrococcus sp. TA1]|uniref:F510_1955 family glycosylhydrolase n=1 Tax=Micrococcus sp. TA1 TaxID=681627 RepID=UPI00161A5233|nr:hypothetical protein [Micrococcus sp. TA1]MBB5747990.1 hypothetical protein [Micrococcus sp. TA1]
MTTLTRRTLIAGGLTLLGAGALAACASPNPATSTPAGTSSQGTGTAITHVHAITRDPESGDVLLATHQGLFRLQDGELTQVGPVVDFMGFSLTPEGHYLASGHPAPGTDLPEPLGLAKSTDRGQTWTVLSRGGASDFHALAAGPNGVLGFDGQLRASTDGLNWQSLTIPAAPAALAISPTTGTVLATTETGMLRSTDHGTTWTTLDTPQLMHLVAWADDTTAVGAGADGHLLTSTDRGDTWTVSDRPVGTASALGAGITDDGQTETLLVTGSTVLSTTGGNTTEPLL